MEDELAHNQGLISTMLDIIRHDTGPIHVGMLVPPQEMPDSVGFA
jgi:hypothetical protein